MYKKIVHRAIFYSGLGVFADILMKKPRGVILAYHRVAPLSEGNALLDDFCVEPAIFEKQIAYIAKQYKVTGVEKISDYAGSRSRHLARSLAISFDDAYADIYTYAFPVLKKYGLPATVFVSTAFIEEGRRYWWDRLAAMMLKTPKKKATLDLGGKRLNLDLRRGRKKSFFLIGDLLKRLELDKQEELFCLLRESLAIGEQDARPSLLSWEQMKEMSRSGITFGAHTHTHQALSSLKAPAALQEEVSRPKELLERHLGGQIAAFAYPYGEPDDFSAQSVEAIKSAGYSYAVTMMQGLVNFGDSSYCLPRIGIGTQDTLETFKLKLAGLIPLRSVIKSRHINKK